METVFETKAGPSVRDRQLLVRTSNFLHISLQINVWISQNSDQDRLLFQLSPEHWTMENVIFCSHPCACWWPSTVWCLDICRHSDDLVCVQGQNLVCTLVTECRMFSDRFAFNVTLGDAVWHPQSWQSNTIYLDIYSALNLHTLLFILGLLLLLIILLLLFSPAVKTKHNKLGPHEIF